MTERGFRDRVYQKAREAKRRIVLPEAEDIRVLEAASKAIELGLAGEILLVGDPSRIDALAKDRRIDLSGVTIINQGKDHRKESFADIFYELRKHKGIGKEDAIEAMRDPLYFGAMLVREGFSDGMVAGASHSTASVLRAGLICVGPKEGIKTVSGSFVIITDEKSFGSNGQLIFADCAIIPQPTSEQLADIAIASAESGHNLIGFKPIIAMLSFSTKGSAKHESINRIMSAIEIVRKKHPELIIDGELQLDAALVSDVAERKCPGSPVGGKANVLIFPDLNSGNIGYKLVQRFGKAEAYGPIVQGLKKPVNDLSRGCFTRDIVNVIAITSVQSLN